MSNQSNETATGGKVVSIHYKLTTPEGELVDQSGQTPLDYLHGQGNIVPGLEKKIEGKSIGDKFDAVVPPEEGYGERAPGGPQAVERSAFPDDVEIQPGMQFATKAPDGQVVPLWVVGVKDDEILIDPNHPLAGQELHFAIEVVNVRDATAEEREHGHVH